MKHLVRKRLLKKRRKQAPSLAQDKNEQIAGRVATLPEFKKAKTLLLYAPIYGEVETKGVFHEALKRKKTVALPKVNGEKLEARQVKEWGTLEKGAFGVNEPTGRQKLLPAEKLDVVFVPGIAFDEEGYRLGYGKGFYDRFLREKARNAKRVGLAYEFQVVKRLPRESHDEKVDVLVTEKRVLRMK